MGKLKTAYYFLFYKLYKFSEAAPSKWLSDWKAGIAIIFLEICLLFSVINYYTVATHLVMGLKLSQPIIILPFIAIIISNYRAFVHTDIWKEYVNKFDKLPKKKNQLYGWIVFGIIILVLGNLIFSFYLISTKK